MGCPVAASSAQAASARVRWSWSAGIGLADKQVEPSEEAAVTGGFLTPAAGLGVGARSLGGGTQAVPAGETGLEQRRVAPVPAGDGGGRELGAVGRQHRAELGFGQGQRPLVLVTDGRVE